MLATLVIGLREGLEAALIVGIIAAFLKRNGHSLRAMWVGVTAAVLLSIGVGVGLELVSANLPQAQQEAMESIIGAVAIVFVTSMIVWMHAHARGMRRELESSATAALAGGTAWALAGMAFLAVLKEGFETSVFLLATFQSSSNAVLAAAGAVVGVLIAVAIGIGLYHGGVKLNLGKFFTVTGVFLVFVAAGLVVSMLRTAHEAGWIAIGQQKVLDLSWLAPNGSIQSALITGVLGIPADPRMIEVIGWLAYLIPMLLFCLLPGRVRPKGAQVPRTQFAIAAAFAAAAIALAVFVPFGGRTVPTAAPVAGGGTATISSTGSSAVLTVSRASGDTRIRFTAGDRRMGTHSGVEAVRWHTDASSDPVNKPARLSIGDLVTLEGGKLPVGVNAHANPGPFDASWARRTVVTAWTLGDRLLDANTATKLTVTITGGGLSSPRTFSVPSTADWQLAPSYVQKTGASASDAAASEGEALLWKLYLPSALGIAALVLALAALRSRARLRSAEREAAAENVTATTEAVAEPRRTSLATK